MSDTHRNPRPRLAKSPSTDNRHATAIRRRALRTTFNRLVRENPQLAGAVLAVLNLIAGADRRRAMQLVEAVSTIVLASPTRAPGPEER
jgi:hypothetical protein